MFRRARKTLVALVLGAAVLGSFALADTGSARSLAVRRQSSSVLTIAAGATPEGGVNPALVGGGDPPDLFVEPAYDSLVLPSATGGYLPGLALSWSSSDRNLKWSFTLRSGVKFSDGSALTAADVKKYFEYVAQAKGPDASIPAGFASIKVTGRLTFEITLKTANPELPLQFTPSYVIGDIIGPKGLQHPDQLGTHTDGAGEYVLDPSATITGEKYTYVVNPNYWDPSAVHFKKIIIDIIADPNAAAESLESGAVDYADGEAQTKGSVSAAGFQVVKSPGNVEGLAILDRDGKLAPALESVKVRQALNYALNRAAIAKAQFGAAGAPLSVFALKGWDGWTPALGASHPYDPTKAKQLLAEAGYPSGFTFTISVPNFQPASVALAQLLASQWSAIGVTAQLNVSTSSSAWAQTVLGAQASGYTFQDTYAPLAQKLNAFVDAFPDGGALDVFHADDPTLNSLLQQAVTATNSVKQASLDDAIMKRETYLGYFVMVASYPSYYYARPGLVVPPRIFNQENPDPVTFTTTTK
jgi:ABC-type transport system substrate-binding protein